MNVKQIIHELPYKPTAQKQWALSLIRWQAPAHDRKEYKEFLFDIPHSSENGRLEEAGIGGYNCRTAPDAGPRWEVPIDKYRAVDLSQNSGMLS
jgi:hypothetical protein